MCGLWLFVDYMRFSVGQSFSFLSGRGANPARKLPHQKPRHSDTPEPPPKTVFSVTFASFSTMRKTKVSRIVGITITFTAYKPHKYVILSVNRELSENIILCILTEKEPDTISPALNYLKVLEVVLRIWLVCRLYGLPHLYLSSCANGSELRLLQLDFLNRQRLAQIIRLLVFL